MVSAKTKKVIKYTYAERVLGSFSLIQREHKKHAIHLASLRAQVQKTANGRKDKLGPHWKNWVGKAVHRLEEDGILTSSEPGTVALTPNGKKAISAARRILALPTNDVLSPDQEDLLWKQVAHPASVYAIKRARPSHLWDDDQASEDDEPHVPPQSRKRARTSLSPRKTGGHTSKLTKAQLMEEIAVLKRAQQADRLRAVSPLTELEDDESEEVLRLKEVLKHKDEEMRFLRSQLAEAPGPSNIFTSRSTYDPVIRTQSGSFIDQLSKQPTPAPTEPDVDDTLMFDDLVSEPTVTHTFTHALVTPEATPAKTHPKGQLNKVSSLENALQIRTAELHNLEHKLFEITSQHTQSQASLSDKDAHISILQTNLRSYESQISEKNNAIAVHSSRVSDLERAKADLEVSIADKVVQFELLVRERDQALASGKKGPNEHEAELSRLRQELSDSEQTVAAYVAEIQTVRSHTTSLDSTIAKLRHELDSQVSSNTVFFAERSHLEAELLEQRKLAGASSDTNQTLSKKIEELERHVKDQVAVQASLHEEAARSDADSSALSAKLREAEAQAESLAAELADATRKSSVAQEGLAAARAAAEALKPQMAALDEALTSRISSQRELQDRLTKAQHETDNFRLKVGILEKSLSTARTKLDSKKLAFDRLEKELKEHVDANLALISTLQERDQQLTQADVAKGELQNRLDEVISKLESAMDACGKLRESRDMIADQLAAADAAKAALILELAAMSAVVNKTAVELRDAESTVDTLGAETIAKEQEIQQLRLQLGQSVGRVREVEQALDVAQSKFVSEIAEKDSTLFALDARLSSARGDVERLTQKLITVQQGHDDIQARMKSDVRRVTDALDAEKLRGKSLEAEREDAIVGAQDVEDELLELRASKDADAATIQSLKETFSLLKSAQMQSFAELDNKLESAHSTPVPRRRGSKVPPRSA
ncbi:hypothetical protein C8R43DRAFT_1043074 [Mycena crocata]|nr:hypothetical protein C8R43DRAFT_1043074 [Mycena crocata]